MQYSNLNNKSFCLMIIYDNEVVVEEKKIWQSCTTIFVRLRKKITYFVEIFDNIYFRI